MSIGCSGKCNDRLCKPSWFGCDPRPEVSVPGLVINNMDCYFNLIQAWGTYRDRSWFFRARFDVWMFTLQKQQGVCFLDDDNVFEIWGDDRVVDLEMADAMHIIEKCIRELSDGA